MLVFDIPSTSIVEGTAAEKKYVVYLISVINSNVDPDITKPSVIERRYTDFSNLYNHLKKEYPSLMNGVNFPKKVVMGNFEVELISSRAAAFKLFLQHIAADARLRESVYTIEFFQGIELYNAKTQIDENKYDKAMYIFETSFRLLNKIYTDRSHVVLLALCRLVACGAGGTGKDPAKSAALAGPVERWATLALKRFEAVSDTELLSLYVPLIKACISIWKVLGKDAQSMEDDLHRMRKRGMKVDECLELSKAIELLENSVNSS